MAKKIVSVTQGNDRYMITDPCALRSYKVIVAFDQATLDGNTGYTDLNNIPVNTAVSYYLGAGVEVANHPPTTHTLERATVITIASSSSSSSGYPIQNDPGKVQFWVDAVDNQMWYRMAWESTADWSEWQDYGSQQFGLMRPYILTGDSQFLDIKNLQIEAGDSIYITGLCTTLDDSYQTYKDKLHLTINCWHTGSSTDYDSLAQYVTFDGQPFRLTAKHNYRMLTLLMNGAMMDALSETNGSAVVCVYIQKSNRYVDMLGKQVFADIRHGLMHKYSARNFNICKLLGLSGNQGDTLTLRVTKTTQNIETIAIFGMYGDVQSDGFDNLGFTSIGAINQIRLNRNYAGFQVWFDTAGVTANTFDVEVEAAVNLGSGVQNDVIELQKAVGNNRHTCNILHKVVCVGDSYTSGHIKAPGDAEPTATNELYAWPHFMEQLTGNTYVNCGSSGATTVTWQTVGRGLPKAQNAGLAQAYIIGLMINDSNGSVPLGTAADIGTDNETYYAQMSKIVRELNEISPLAKIFINTCPKDDPTRYDPYNQAVRDIVQAYKDTYPVHCVDLARDYKHLYTAQSLTGDVSAEHYTALGYEQFAEIYSYVLSDYINTHISDFQNVYKIPYDS